MEYVNEKGFLSEQYNPKEVLAIATFKERCVASGQFFLKGLYPLESHRYTEEIQHHEDELSPINGTMYQKILRLIDSKSNKCQAGPIIEINHDVDLMMHTRNCKTLHEYLNKDKFDVELLHRMVREYFGEDTVKSTEDALEAYFQRDI